MSYKHQKKHSGIAGMQWFFGKRKVIKNRKSQPRLLPTIKQENE